MSAPRCLPAELTVYAVGEAALAWTPWLLEDAGSEALPVDASAVADVDGAGIQLLISLANALQQRGRSLALLQPSATLASACGRLGAGFLLAPSIAPETAA